MIVFLDSTTTITTPNATIDITPHSANANAPQNGIHRPQRGAPTITENSITLTITPHTPSWASLFSSRSLMVKTLGYGSAPVWLIEDRMKMGLNILELDGVDADGMQDEGVMGKGRAMISMVVLPRRRMWVALAPSSRRTRRM